MSELESQQSGTPPADGPDLPACVPPVESTSEPPVVAALPPKRKSRVGTFFLGALSGCALVFGAIAFLVILGAAMGRDSGELNFGSNKVAVIPIEGEILDARDALDALRRYANSATVKAIVIRVNSPGGAIAPSQEIYAAIRRTRADTGKPIVASLDSVAASGGFYIASACDEIVANPGSITGSIGVILQWFDVKELMQWAKLKSETITSGAMKDAGSPYRQITPEERAYFQGVVTQLHTQFVRDVAIGRKGKMTQADVARIADGRIFTGEQALAIKLVDRMGSIDDAVRRAAKLAGIRGEPTMIWPRRRERKLFDLFGDTEAAALLERIAARRVPQFLFRW
jgi:protease-4